MRLLRREKPASNELLSSPNFQVVRVGLDLAKPIPGGSERAFRSKPNQEKMRLIQDQFRHADLIVAICGTFGLGDAVMQTRYALEIARQTGQPVMCQVPEPLVAPFSLSRKQLPNLAFVSKVPWETLERPRTFFFTLESGFPGNLSAWLEGAHEASRQTYYEHVNACDYILQSNRSFSESAAMYSFPGEKKMEVYSRLKVVPKARVNSFDQGYSAVLQLLGLEAEAGRLSESTLTPFSPAEVDAIPQDLAAVVAPDAKEFSLASKNRSEKSLSLDTWSKLWAAWPKQEKISVVEGVSHPDYCREVLARARQQGLSAEGFRGSLLELTRHILRGRVFVGMDSGTTHLAVEVVRAARAAGREIKLREIFNSKIVPVDSYGVTEGLIANAKTWDAFENPNDSDIELLRQFLLS